MFGESGMTALGEIRLSYVRTQRNIYRRKWEYGIYVFLGFGPHWL